MRQMKPLLKEPFKEYTWSYKFDTGLVGGYVDQYSGGHNNWWMSSCYCPFNQAGFPFWFPEGITATVDWGDGNIETINGSTVLAFDGIHTYSNACQTYTISITSNQWNHIWLCSGDPGCGGYPNFGYPGRWYKHDSSFSHNLYDNPDYYGNAEYGFDYDSGFDNNITGQLASMRMGCIEILTPLPPVAGVVIADHLGTDINDYKSAPSDFFNDDMYPYGTFLPNSMYFAFAYYIRLTNAPSNLFENNTRATDFTWCLDFVPTSVANLIQYDKSKEQQLEMYEVMD